MQSARPCAPCPRGLAAARGWACDTWLTPQGWCRCRAARRTWTRGPALQPPLRVVWRSGRGAQRRRSVAKSRRRWLAASWQRRAMCSRRVEAGAAATAAEALHGERFVVLLQRVGCGLEGLVSAWRQHLPASSLAHLCGTWVTWALSVSTCACGCGMRVYARAPCRVSWSSRAARPRGGWRMCGTRCRRTGRPRLSPRRTQRRTRPLL
jgi:hypothetical protein